MKSAREFWILNIAGLVALASYAAPAVPRFTAGFSSSPDASRYFTQGPGYSLELSRDGAAFKTVRMRWLGANANPAIEGVESMSGPVSYFVGNDPKRWRTGVRRYAAVKYSNVYPGIDLLFHTRNGVLEYDWMVAPGADPKQIQLEFTGASEVRATSDGDLLIRAGGEEIRQPKPGIFQSDRKIAGGYVVLPGNRVSFVVGRYDRRRPLTIDPVLSYSTLLGGSNNDGAFAVTTDKSGNAYVAGLTASTDFAAATGALAAPKKTVPATSAFVAKLNAAGQLQYLAYLGGSGEDSALAIAVDAAGNAYVTGGTTSRDFPTTAGVVQSAYGGTGGSSLPPSFNPGGDVFVAKLNPTGSALVYSTYLGGRGKDQGYGIAVDGAGNAYVAGSTDSTATSTGTGGFPTTAGALQTKFGGSSDGFVTKLNASATSLLYSSLVGGSNEDYIFGLAVDGSGNAYVTGLTASSDFTVTSGAVQPKYVGEPMAFVSKLNAAGTALAYSTYLGGARYTAAYGIAVDSAGSAYVTGVTNSPDFPVTAGAFVTPNRAAGAQGDVFVAKVNPAGSALSYASVFGGNGTDYGTSIVAGPDGSAYIAGRTFSFGARYTSIPTTPDALQRCGSNDAFLAKLDATGSTLVYSSHLGGNSKAAATSLALSSDGAVWVAGSTNNAAFPVTAGALQSAYKGEGSGSFDSDNLLPYGGDAFITKVDLTGSLHLQAGCVVNGASFGLGSVSPGAIVSILGGGMGPAVGVGGAVTNGRLQTTIAETRVLFDGIPAPLLYVRSDQINAVVPYGVSGSTTQIQVEYKGEKSNTISAPVAAATPAVFTSNASGTGQGAVLNQDGSVNSPANPAARGSVVSLYATGLGQTDPAGEDGKVNGDVLPKPLLTAGVFIGPGEAEIRYAGAAPLLVAGAFQVNFVIPAGIPPSDATPILLFVKDSRGVITGGQDGVTIAVR